MCKFRTISVKIDVLLFPRIKDKKIVIDMERNIQNRKMKFVEKLEGIYMQNKVNKVQMQNTAYSPSHFKYLGFGV